MLLNVFIGLIVLSSPVWARDPAFCEDLAKVACSPGRTKDVSGSAVSRSHDFNITNVIEMHRGKFEKQFMEILNNPDQNYFRRIARNVMSINNPECQFISEVKKKACNEIIVDGLMEIAKNQSTETSKIELPPGVKLNELTYLTENQNFLGVMDSIQNTLVSSFNTKKREDYIRDELFGKVRVYLLKKIQSMNMPGYDKQLMIDKVRSIQFQGFDCPRGAGKTKIDQHFYANAMYSPVVNHFHVCNGLNLKAATDSHIVKTIAHEMAHSIDPCQIQYGPRGMAKRFDDSDIEKAEQQYPLTNLVKCLRKKKSVHAKRDDSFLELIGIKIAGTNKPMFCEDDQIGESVSDWFGVEVLAEFTKDTYPKMNNSDSLNYFSNSFKAYCKEKTKDDEFGVHPHAQDRLNRLVLRHPYVRQKLKCTKNVKAGYCDGVSPDPIMSSPSADGPDTSRKGEQ